MVQKVCQNRIRDNKLRYSVSLHKNIKNLKLRDEKGRCPGKGCSPSLLLLLLLHRSLLSEHHLDKLLVVDVPLRVLLPMYQLLHLVEAKRSKTIFSNAATSLGANADQTTISSTNLV